MARPLSSSLVFRCPGLHTRRPPVLGVVDESGGLRILKDALKLTVHQGPVLIGCRGCGLEHFLLLPLTQQSAAALTGYVFNHDSKLKRSESVS